MTEETDFRNETLVFPSTVVSHHFQKYLMEKYNLKATENSRFIEWDRFTALLREVPEDKIAVRPLDRRIFIEQILEKNAAEPFLRKLIPLKMAAESRSYRAVLQQALTELPVFAADREAFDALPELQSDLTQLLNLYRVFLETYRLYEPDLERKRSAADTERYRIFYPEVLPDFENYRALLGDNVAVSPVPEVPLRTVKLFSSDVSEVRYVFSEIEKLLQSGEPVENIAIACVDGSYRFLLNWFSFIYQIPLVNRTGKKVGDYPVNRFFKAWYEAVSSRFTFSSFQQLFFDPVLPWKTVEVTDENGTVSREKISTLLMNAFNNVNVLSEEKNWQAEFRKVSPQAETVFTELQKELRKAVSSSTFAALQQNVQDFLRKRFDDSQRDDASRAVYQRALTKLKELSETERHFAEIGDRKKLFETVLPFEFWLRELDSEVYVEQDSGAKIAVYNGKVAAGAPIPHLFVIGINESSYRFVSAPFGFLSDFDREEIRRKELRESDRTEAIYRLYSGTEGSRVYLSGALTVCGESRFTPSLFYAADAVEPVSVTGIPAPEKINGMPDEAHLRRYSRLFPTAAHAPVFRYNPAGEERITLSEEDMRNGLAGRVTDPQTGLKKISDTALETAETCPFRWFLSRYQPETMKTDVFAEEANQFGILVHSAAEYYVKECAPSVNAEEDEDLRRQQVQAFLDSYIERLESGGDDKIRIDGFKKPQPVLWEAWKQNLYDYIRYFAEADRTVFGDCKENFTEGWYSARIGDKALLTGRIDRVLKIRHGYYFVDYKTGKLPSPKNICPTREETEEGNQPSKYQIAAYACLMEAKNYQPLSGAYYYGFKNDEDSKGFFYLFTDDSRINTDPKETCHRGLRKNGPQADIAVMKERFAEAVDRYIEMIDGRTFAIQPGDDACRYCRFASICRKDFGIKG
ncbi:MAG: PD-(D/E)XK nuclease family protein [Spirochaetia bacterium]|nr:PD-(D/E)XK nuclease family protein [Spirochaetia bacterium]